MTDELLPLCECGCGEHVTKKGNKFIAGHQNRGENNPMCGEKHTIETCAKISAALKGVPKPPRTPEHCAAMSEAHTGVPLSLERCAAISKAKTGVPLSPEHIAAMVEAWKSRPPFSDDHIANIIESHKNSDAVKVASIAMRGGHDIVDHHYIYDHANPLKYIMKMTRTIHSKLHRLFQMNGIDIPHINESAGKWRYTKRPKPL